ncbi:Chromosomal replication initiator protein DnaA [Bienertia sinuspersici]
MGGESLSSESFKYKFGYNQRGQTGDHSKHVDEGVSVSSPKDGQLIVADAGATGTIPEAPEGDQTNKKQNDDDVPSENGRISDVAIPEYIRQNTPEKVKEYIDLVEEEIDVDDSHLESLISDIEKSIENYSTTDEDIKKEFGEEVGKNVMEDVGSTKMEEVSIHNEEKKIADHKNVDSFVCEIEVSKKGKAESRETIDSYNDLPVANCDIIVSRTLQLQRNKYLAELSDQERVLADFLFYSEYNDVSMLSIDENNPAVIQKNEELRHTLESSVLLDMVNTANPDIHVSMTKTDFLNLAPKTWLTGASMDACSYVFNRREEEKPGTPRRLWFNILPFNYINWLIDERKKKEKIESIIAEKEIDLEKAKDNPCYDTMKAEWTIPFTWRSNQNDFDCGVYCIKAMELYDGWNEKKHPITTLSTPFLIQQHKKRKDKEKHLENL